MQSNISKQKIWALARNTATVIGLTMLIYNGLAGVFGSSGATTVHAQTDPFLSRRVDILEQRLYSIESRLNSINTQARPSVVPSIPSTTQNDVDFLRTQVDGMRLRIGEVECGLLKLDERTLAAAQRRTHAGTTSDRCRENYGTPIQLSARP
ncbi:MAG: hypothetical protein JO314_08990 [Acidobacteria bacterium]|nr:hypothetical protein [Acidobacteriota bacterium]